jgi:hypothetical protein
LAQFLPNKQEVIMSLDEEITKVAYELFERDGRVHGKDEAHWLEAEKIVRMRHAVQHSQKEKPKTSTASKTAAVKKVPASKKRSPKPMASAQKGKSKGQNK